MKNQHNANFYKNITVVPNQNKRIEESIHRYCIVVHTDIALMQFKVKHCHQRINTHVFEAT